MPRFGRKARSRHTTGISPFVVGSFVIAAVAVFSYFAYTKVNPLANPYEFSAVFETASNLKPKSPVRIAGIGVGEVTEVEPVGDEGAARVTMKVDDSALPLHEDAEAKIRPRIFLEGNFFVDVKPGSPSSPELADGGQIPIQQTATPVQFADVLAALQSDTREDLQILLKEYSRGLEGKGAEGLNEVFEHGERAYRESALANEAALGTEERDLSRLVRGQQRTFRALVRNEEDLKDLVTNFNTFAGALAREDEALAATIPALDGVLRVGSPALRSLNNSLPSVRAFARDALPGTISSGPTIDANLPFIRQARQLVGERELKGLVADLRQTIPDLVQLNEGQIEFQEQGRALSACQTEVLVPFAQTPIPDPDFPNNTGQPFFKQSSRGLVGLSGESRLVDANSPMFNFNFGSGPTTLVQPGEDGSQFFGTALFPPLGTRPVRPPRRPDFRPDIPCETQEPPDLNALGGPADTQSVQADATPRNERDRKRTEKEQGAARDYRQHLEDAAAGRPTLNPLDYTSLESLLAAAKERGLRKLDDGRYVRIDEGGEER